MRISPVSGSTGTLNHCALKATERGVPPKCPSAHGSWRWAAAKSSRWSARAREARRAGPAEGALAEVVAHAGQGAVGRPADGTAFAVVGGVEVGALRDVWSPVAAAGSGVPLYGGTGAPVDIAQAVNGALAEAR